MDSLSVSYAQGTVPTILISLETTNGRKMLAGDIDSGSDRSLIPLEHLGDLGLRASDLKKNKDRGLASDGNTFDTWSTRGKAITGQISLPSDGGFKPWGPIFRLRPYFAETGSLLLGQLDFFAAFDVHFDNAPGGPTFELRPYQQAIPGP